MPIKPENRHFYRDPKYLEMSEYVKWDRAGGCCENCGAVANTLILRSNVTNSVAWMFWDWREGGLRTPDNDAVHPDFVPDEFDHDRVTTVVLTCAHLDHDPSNNTESNLKCLCAACHLIYDRLHHVGESRITRNTRRHQKIAATGQQAFDFGGDSFR